MQCFLHVSKKVQVYLLVFTDKATRHALQQNTIINADGLKVMYNYQMIKILVKNFGKRSFCIEKCLLVDLSSAKISTNLPKL